MSPAPKLEDACGCEPVRKDSSDSIKLDADSEHTEWIPPIKAADFLLKLYTGEPYSANDRVIHLEPATISHEEGQAVAEDPGVIDPSIFNYSADQIPDFHGIREGEMLTDEVILFLAKQLLEAYPVQEFDGDTPSGAVLSHPKVYFGSPAVSYLFTQKEWRLDPKDPADRPQINDLRNLILNYTYFVYLVHSGGERSGHYYCVVYNKATTKLLVLDSSSRGKTLSEYTKVFVRSFTETLKSIELHPPQRIKAVNAPSSQQHDGNSCGFYAVHNTHRVLHALCRGGLEDQPELFDKFITQTGDQELSDLPTLTPQLISEWRLKLRRVFYEKIRRVGKILTFSDLRDIKSLPDYHVKCHAWHFSKNKEARLFMTPTQRASIRFDPRTNIPYDEIMVPPTSFEHYTPDSNFAQLEMDWKREDVAGVIIRLSQSPEPAKQQMYRAVGWDQTVLLSCLPHSTKGYNLNRATGTAMSKAEVIESCRQEIAKLTQSRPDLKDSELSTHSRYLIGMHCVDTPKLIIKTNRDGTTWAKANWPCDRYMRELDPITINGVQFRTVPGGMVRLPDYAYIILGKTKSPYQAHYIWAQKWPHAGRFQKEVSQIPKAIPYVNPGIWNWWNLDDLLQEGQIEYNDPDLDHLGGPHLNKWNTAPVPPYQAPLLPQKNYLKVKNHKDNKIIQAVQNISGIDITTPRKRTASTEGRQKTTPRKRTASTEGRRKTTPRKRTASTEKRRKTTPRERTASTEGQRKTTPRKRTASTEGRQEKTTPTHKRRRVRDADAFLELDRTAVDDPNSSYAKYPVISKLHAYLASLLVGTYGPASMNENGELERINFKCGHLHHHHRPYQTIIDHQWRVQYYTQVQPGRFPWPNGITGDIKTMVRACQTIHELKQEVDPADAGEWKKLAHLLQFGEKTLRLWHSKPLRHRQTMRCMSAKCEELRQLCLRFEASGLVEEEKYWDMFLEYQQWKYGAQDCPKGCPLREFDCPENCRVVHHSPLDIKEKDFSAITKTLTEIPLQPSQSKYVETFLDEMFPLRWTNAPPPYWMPMRALKGFWDPKNKSVTALKARANACTKRLYEWQRLPKSEQDAILKGIDEVYYDDVEQYFKDADWKGKSRAAQTCAQNYARHRKRRPKSYTRMIRKYMQEKMDGAGQDAVIDWGTPRMIDPKTITFASLSEFS